MIPKDHPRYRSLIARKLLEEGVKSGLTTPTGMVAFGRGEAFDYLLGECSHEFSHRACKAAAAMLLEAKHPVISINGNTAMLVPEEMVSLSKAVPSALEINIFHDAPERRELIAQRFAAFGAEVFGKSPDALIPGLSSERAKVDSRGILIADVVIVSLEDGDRTEVLVQSGKKVIAIDLNPLSRTPQRANISITDNVTRAIPLIEQYVLELKGKSSTERQAVLAIYDNAEVLLDSERAIREGFKPTL